MSYLANAQKRATRRKSKWNLLLLVVCITLWLTFHFTLYEGIKIIHNNLYPTDIYHGEVVNFAGHVAMLSLLFASLPLSFLLGNVFIWLVPPARRALDAEAKPHSKTDFLSAQKGLLKMVLYVTLPCLLLSLIGTALPWQLT